MEQKQPEEGPKKPMSVREAGRKGGAVTAKRYGSEFYSEIGRKGGDQVRKLVERARETEE